MVELLSAMPGSRLGAELGHHCVALTLDLHQENAIGRVLLTANFIHSDSRGAATEFK
jgi:hypothetical protein